MNSAASLSLLEKSFSKAASTYAQAAVVQKQMAEKLLSVALPLVPEHRALAVLDAGCGTGFCASLLLHSPQVILQELWLNDLSPAMLEQSLCELTPAAARTGVQLHSLTGDVLSLASSQDRMLSGRFDVLISNAVFQWFADLQRAVSALRALLQPEGLLCFSTFVSGTLQEVSSLLGHALPYQSTAEVLHSVRSGGFEIAAWQEQTFCAYFDSGYAMLRHFKNTGVNAAAAARDRRPLTRSSLQAFVQDYERSCRTEQGLPLTFNTLFVAARPQSIQQEDKER